MLITNINKVFVLLPSLSELILEFILEFILSESPESILVLFCSRLIAWEPEIVDRERKMIIDEVIICFCLIFATFLIRRFFVFLNDCLSHLILISGGSSEFSNKKIITPLLNWFLSYDFDCTISDNSVKGGGGENYVLFLIIMVLLVDLRPRIILISFLLTEK